MASLALLFHRKAPAMTLPLLLAAIACLILAVGVDGCVLTIRNNCPYPVTACARSGAGPTARYQLSAYASQGLDFGSACRWPSAVVFASVGGGCTDANLANLAEFNIGQSSIDFYDLSNVDAYTIGLQIIPARGGCRAPLCSIANIPAFCTGGNRLDSFPTGAFSCHNTDGQIGYATDRNRRFKAACPDAYSYNFDDATSTWTCATGTDYQVVFCPLGSAHAAAAGAAGADDLVATS